MNLKEKIDLLNSSIIYQRIAANSSCAETLEVLVKSEFEEIRALVASNPFTDPRTLAKLVDDTHYEVLYALSKNRNLPKKAFSKLAECGLIIRLNLVNILGYYEIENQLREEIKALEQKKHLI